LPVRQFAGRGSTPELGQLRHPPDHPVDEGRTYDDATRHQNGKRQDVDALHRRDGGVDHHHENYCARAQNPDQVDGAQSVTEDVVDQLDDGRRVHCPAVVLRLPGAGTVPGH
jgi:hypothetical protein